MSCGYVFFVGVLCLCIIESQTTALNRSLGLHVNDNSCYIEEYGKHNNKPISEAEWIEGIDISSSILDIEPCYTKLYTARTRNIRRILNVQVNDKFQGLDNSYVDYLLVREKGQNSKEFILTLDSGFENYEEYEYSAVMKIKMTFLCENGDFKSLEIRQKIIDTNNHDPEFIPMNFQFFVPENLGVNYLIGQISARDSDLTNYYIDFNFLSTGTNTDGEYALLGSHQNPYDPKMFHAWFITTTNVSYYSKFINIYAQDSGKPSRISSTYVQLLLHQFTTDPNSFTTTIPYGHETIEP